MGAVSISVLMRPKGGAVIRLQRELGRGAACWSWNGRRGAATDRRGRQAQAMSRIPDLLPLTLGSSAASGPSRSQKARRKQSPVGAILDPFPRHRAGEMVRRNLQVAQRSAAHMAHGAQPDLPCLPLRPYLLPSAPHRISTTLTFFFFSVLKYMQPLLPQGLCTCCFLSLGALFFLIPSQH